MCNTKFIHKGPICKGSGLMVYNTDINYFIDLIDKKKYFSFVRLQIEWWCTARIALQFMGYKGWMFPNNIDFSPKFLKKWGRKMVKAWDEKQCYKRPWVFEAYIFESILNMVISEKDDNFYLSVSDRAWYFGKLPPKKGAWPWSNKMIKSMIPAGEIPFNSICWRRWGHSGEIHKFFNKFKNKRIAIVGPYYFKNFGEKLGLKKYTHIEIDHIRACHYVENYLEQIKRYHNEVNSNEDVIYFFSGGSPGIWLIQQLHSKLSNAFLIDIGRALDVYYFYDKIRIGDARWKWGSWLERNPPIWVKNRNNNIIV